MTACLQNTHSCIQPQFIVVSVGTVTGSNGEKLEAGNLRLFINKISKTLVSEAKQESLQFGEGLKWHLSEFAS